MLNIFESWYLPMRGHMAMLDIIGCRYSTSYSRNRALMKLLQKLPLLNGTRTYIWILLHLNCPPARKGSSRTDLLVNRAIKCASHTVFISSWALRLHLPLHSLHLFIIHIVHRSRVKTEQNIQIKFDSKTHQNWEGKAQWTHTLNISKSRAINQNDKIFQSLSIPWNS